MSHRIPLKPESVGAVRIFKILVTGYETRDIDQIWENSFFMKKIKYSKKLY